MVLVAWKTYQYRWIFAFGPYFTSNAYSLFSAWMSLFPISVYVPLSLWIVYHLLKLSAIPFPAYFQSYADDLLFIPIIMGLGLLLQQRWIAPTTPFIYSNRALVCVWVYCCIVFELLFPLFNSSFTADWFDCIAYACGALWFKVGMNKPLTKWKTE